CYAATYIITIALTLFSFDRRRCRRSTLFPYTTLFRSWQDLIQARQKAGLLLGVYTHRPPLRGVECTIGITSEQSHEHKRKDLHRDRKSTRLNSSHVKISYAVFCLKKKKKK